MIRVKKIYFRLLSSYLNLTEFIKLSGLLWEQQLQRYTQCHNVTCQQKTKEVSELIPEAHYNSAELFRMNVVQSIINRVELLILTLDLK